MVYKSSLSINLGLVVGLHLQQPSDLLDHQVRKSFEYSRDFWKTNEKRPLVIQSPYISHKYNLRYLQSYDLLDHYIQKVFECSSRDFWKILREWPLVIQCPYISHQYHLKYLQSSELPDH